MRKPGLGIPSVAVDLERARAFVLAHGSVREKARLAGIFGHREPERAMVKELEQLQNPDGGFPLGQRPGAESSIETTCYVLAQLRDLPPLPGSPMASRALSFLRRVQRADGSWAESPAVAAEVPGPYLTANAAYTLLVMERQHLDPIRRASKWLRGALGQQGAGEQAYGQTLFLAAAVWGQMLEAGAAEQVWAYELLSQRQLSAPEIAWWLTTLVELGLEARFFPLVLQQLERLAALQGEDGGWPGEEGEAVEATLSALRVFHGFRVI